jgi:hypothetical protein
MLLQLLRSHRRNRRGWYVQSRDSADHSRRWRLLAGAELQRWSRRRFTCQPAAPVLKPTTRRVVTPQCAQVSAFASLGVVEQIGRPLSITTRPRCSKQSPVSYLKRLQQAAQEKIGGASLSDVDEFPSARRAAPLSGRPLILQPGVAYRDDRGRSHLCSSRCRDGWPVLPVFSRYPGLIVHVDHLAGDAMPSVAQQVSDDVSGSALAAGCERHTVDGDVAMT